MAIDSIADLSNFSPEFVVPLTFSIGDYSRTEQIPVKCPNEKDPSHPHDLVKNGRDTHLKTAPQQFLCRTCGNSFYAHTSKFVTDLERDLKDLIRTTIQNGKISLPALSSRLRVKQSLASHLLGRILDRVSKFIKSHPSFRKKIRRSTVLFVDETFIKICHKTWYLIVAISGTNEIMDLKLTEHRDEATLLPFIQSCTKRLLFGLWLLVTDGLQAYKGIAKTLAKEYGRSLVHIRHIHKPNYHDIEMDYYDITPTHLKITTSNYWNDVFRIGGAFVAYVRERSEPLQARTRGRKAGGKNRPKEVIAQAKIQKQNANKKRGRPKGSTKDKNRGEPNVFVYKKTVGSVEALWKSSEAVAAALNIALEQFAGFYITTNLIEKEFSVLKELLDFRGRRNPDHWFDLLTAYYALRDDPGLLECVLDELNISPRTIRHAMSALVTTEILSI
jgi:hypothetical protein